MFELKQALADVKRLKSDVLVMEDEVRVLKSRMKRDDLSDGSNLVTICFLPQSLLYLRESFDCLVQFLT